MWNISLVGLPICSTCLFRHVCMFVWCIYYWSLYTSSQLKVNFMSNFIYFSKLECVCTHNNLQRSAILYIFSYIQLSCKHWEIGMIIGEVMCSRSVTCVFSFFVIARRDFVAVAPNILVLYRMCRYKFRWFVLIQKTCILSSGA